MHSGYYIGDKEDEYMLQEEKYQKKIEENQKQKGRGSQWREY